MLKTVLVKTCESTPRGKPKQPAVDIMREEAAAWPEPRQGWLATVASRCAPDYVEFGDLEVTG